MEKSEPKTPGLKSLLSPSEWWVTETAFEVSKISFYETIFTIGNGYLGTRGALEEGHRASFPGTYINGLFDNHDSTVVDLVNAPNWLPITIWVEGEVLDMQNCEILNHERILDLKKGMLYRTTTFKDNKGRTTRYESLRFASFADQHLCETQIELTAENYSGKITIESTVDGNTFNLDRLPQYTTPQTFEPEVKWEKWAKSKHLYSYETDTLTNGVYLETKTKDRPHTLGYASCISVPDGNRTVRNGYDHSTEVVHLDVQQGETCSIEKLVSIYTSRDIDGNIKDACVESLQKHLSSSAQQRLEDHTAVLEEKWDDCDIIIDGDDKASNAVRFNIYHLLICASPFDEKANIGAKSLSGEGYKGHVFWDTEIFMLPFYIFTQPETAKALLLYRYNMLEGAKENAKIEGFTGARYPWESADTGLEETPKWTHDGKDRIWTGEEEIHITSDVVFGLLSYHTATGDTEFFLNYSAEILFETARFWMSRLEYNKDKDYYELNNVIGPDEFHEHINNSVFTNWLTKWNLEQSVACFNLLTEKHPEKLSEISSKIFLEPKEVIDWKEKAEKVFIPFDEGKKMVEQFEGYFQRREVPIVEWDENNMPRYPEGLTHFTCNDTTLLKQPDVVMLMYILPDEFSDEIKKINYEYYEARTMHKSSLSPSIHTIMGIETRNTDKALQYFERSAFVDLVNNQGNTPDGMHIASAGGTWQSVVNGFGGMRVKNQQLHFKPWLPDHWNSVKYKIRWKGDSLQVAVGKNEISFLWETKKDEQLSVFVVDQSVSIKDNELVSVSY